MYASASMFLAAVALFASQPTLAIENHSNGDVVRYPVVLLRGKANPDGEVVISSATNRGPDGRYETKSVNGRFVGLVELLPGRNQINVTSGGKRESLTIEYAPAKSEHVVEVIWLVPEDERTTYASPFLRDPQNYEAKLDTVAKLMQTMTAESLHEHGFGRKTFALNLDEKGRVRVQTLVFPHKRSELVAKEGGELWGMINSWLVSRKMTDLQKNLVLMSFTEYDAKERTARAHTALGGGALALFGGATVWSWPATIRDAQSVFADDTSIDPAHALDDSAGRSTRWALASTTIGACLHELGHTLGLPHTADPTCIMSRGFDRFNRVFTLVEPKSARNSEPIVFSDESQNARWSPYFAAQLSVSRWFVADSRTYDSSNRPKISVEGAEVVIESPHGLAFVGYQIGDPVTKSHHELTVGAPTRFTISTEALSSRVGDSGERTVLAIDRQGNTSRHTIKSD